MYSVQTAEAKSCLTGSTQEPLHSDDRRAQQQGRGQAEQVWAGELEHPGLWIEKHNSCILDLNSSNPCRVDDGKIGRGGNSIIEL